MKFNFCGYLSVEGGVCLGGHDDADDGPDDGGHPVQVVHAARVVDQEAVLQVGLKEWGSRNLHNFYTYMYVQVSHEVSSVPRPSVQL